MFYRTQWICIYNTLTAFRQRSNSPSTSVQDITLNNLMLRHQILELWVMQCTTSLPSLPGSHWIGVPLHTGSVYHFTAIAPWFTLDRCTTSHWIGVPLHTGSVYHFTAIAPWFTLDNNLFIRQIQMFDIQTEDLTLKLSANKWRMPNRIACNRTVWTFYCV